MSGYTVFVRLFYSPAAVAFFLLIEFVIFFKEIIKREEVKDNIETSRQLIANTKKQKKNTGCATTYNIHYKATNISDIDATHPLS